MSADSDPFVEEIVRQCEFYFSDANILKDQYMLNQVKATPDGWVKLSVIEGFKRMKKLARGHEFVIKALASSSKLELSEDGLRVRRRDPLPKWDPAVYTRSIIISDAPEGIEFSLPTVTDLLTAEGFPPLLVRMCPPDRKVPPDLRRSQPLHPQLGSKLCAIVEFPDRSVAARCMKRIRKLWPDCYSELLNKGPIRAAESAAKRNEARKKKQQQKPDSDPQPARKPAFLLGFKSRTETTRVIHTREPIGPPSEDSCGFAPKWRELLRLQRKILLSSDGSANAVCPAAPVTSPVPDDSAIVSITPSTTPLVAMQL
jgi:hypothetical protein